MLIDLNNAVGPYLGEICAIFYLIAAASLLRAWKRSRTPDALVVFFYLTVLIAVVYLPNTWLNLSAMMVIHLLAYTGLVWLHTTYGSLHTRFGDYLLLMAAMLGLVDALFLGWSLPIQYQVWLIDLIFITMCVTSFYVCLKSPYNGGNLGQKHDATPKYSKIIARTLKG